MNEASNSEGLIKDSNELIIKEFQTLISVFYLVLVGLGMIFNAYKYAEFGINIFDYADAFDFLIAPFQDIYIIVFALLSTIVPYTMFRIDAYLKKNKPLTYTKMNLGLDKKLWYKRIGVSLFIGLCIFYLTVAGSMYGAYFKENIQEQSTLSVVMYNNEVVEGKLIGKTQDIIFVLVDQKVIAIPVNSSVRKFEIQQPIRH